MTRVVRVQETSPCSDSHYTSIFTLGIINISDIFKFLIEFFQSKPISTCQSKSDKTRNSSTPSAHARRGQTKVRIVLTRKYLYQRFLLAPAIEVNSCYNGITKKQKKNTIQNVFLRRPENSYSQMNLSNERLKVYESISPNGIVEIPGKIDLQTFNRSQERFI